MLTIFEYFTKYQYSPPVNNKSMLLSAEISTQIANFQLYSTLNYHSQIANMTEKKEEIHTTPK